MWQGQVAICIAPGPSLVREDVDQIPASVRVIAINDAVRIVPRPDVVYSSDGGWWTKAIKKQRYPEAAVLPVSALWMTIAQTRNGARKLFSDRMFVFKHTGKEGWDPDPYALRSLDNSGGAAIQVAAKLGASRILLLGYDMAIGPDGRKHFCDQQKMGGSNYRTFRTLIGTLVAPFQTLGIDVINCSRRSRLDCFPRLPLAEALGLPVERVA